VVREPQRPIHVFFDHHMSRAEIGMNLIEPPLIHTGEILPQTPGGLETQAPLQHVGHRFGSMQIGGL